MDKNQRTYILRDLEQINESLKKLERSMPDQQARDKLGKVEYVLYVLSKYFRQFPSSGSERSQ
jgi:hypothetical protein